MYLWARMRTYLMTSNEKEEFLLLAIISVTQVFMDLQ